KKFLYCEPHKRIKEVLEEELYIKRDECHIKNPAAVALEGIWSIKRNLPVEGLKPGLPSRNSLLPQAKYYSRHGELRGGSGARTTNPCPSGFHYALSSKTMAQDYWAITAENLVTVQQAAVVVLWLNRIRLIRFSIKEEPLSADV
ncbi:hypothetical protein H8959_002527, partial [Pygathrix nigripes]